jgi:hypothetical protein
MSGGRSVTATPLAVCRRVLRPGRGVPLTIAVRAQPPVRPERTSFRAQSGCAARIASPSGSYRVFDASGLGDHAIVSPDEDAKALEVALELACRAHRGQRYPSPEREPYVLHLLRVMLAVDGFRVQAAAVLHDVLEDTEVTVGELGAAGLPIDVVNAVVTLTQRPGQSYPRYIEQVARDAIAREVKLADLADNLANNKRLPNAPDVVARIERYEQAIRRLKEVSETSSK